MFTFTEVHVNRPYVNVKQIVRDARVPPVLLF